MAEGVLSEVPKGSRVISLISFGDASAQGFTGRILINPSGKKNWRSAGLLRVTPGGVLYGRLQTCTHSKKVRFLDCFRGIRRYFCLAKTRGDPFISLLEGVPDSIAGWKTFEAHHAGCRTSPK